MKTNFAATPLDIQSIPDDSDEIDELNDHRKDFRVPDRPRRLSNHTASAGTQPLGLSKIVKSPRRGSQEYWDIEYTMNSKGYRSSRDQNVRLSQNDRSSTVIESPLDRTKISAIESSHPKLNVELPRYQGTARPGAKSRTKDGTKGAVTEESHDEEQSRYFKHSGNSLPASTNPTVVVSMMNHRNSDTRVHNSQMLITRASDKARSSDGYNISSDELAGEPPGDDYAEVKLINDVTTPQHLSRQVSPVEIGEPSFEDTGLAKSNIPSSSFKRSRQMDIRQNIPIHLSARLILIRGILLKGDIRLEPPSANSMDLEVFYNYNGIKYTKGSEDLRIRADKLQNIQWSASSLKVRLETSKVGAEDNKIYIEFSSAKDATKAVTRLSENSNCRVVKIPR